MKKYRQNFQTIPSTSAHNDVCKKTKKFSQFQEEEKKEFLFELSIEFEKYLFYENFIEMERSNALLIFFSINYVFQIFNCVFCVCFHNNTREIFFSSSIKIKYSIYLTFSHSLFLLLKEEMYLKKREKIYLFFNGNKRFIRQG